MDILCLEGCIVTIDAMGTQKETARKIIHKNVDYILRVKGNQQTLMDDIREYFEKDVFTEKKDVLEKSGRYHKDLCGEHGRMEKREYYVENDTEWLRQRHPEWEGLAGIGGMCIYSDGKREYCNSRKLRHIQQERDDSGRIWGKCKAHWGIENSLHWVLDIAFREDESRIRAGNAAENMNMARHIGANLLKQEKSCKMGIAAILDCYDTEFYLVCYPCAKRYTKSRINFRNGRYSSFCMSNIDDCFYMYF